MKKEQEPSLDTLESERQAFENALDQALVCGVSEPVKVDGQTFVVREVNGSGRVIEKIEI